MLEPPADAIANHRVAKLFGDSEAKAGGTCSCTAAKLD
jgi:hypothetical protein